MIKFGDIYRFKDQGVYIHLAVKDDGVTYYAAKIISEPGLIDEFLRRRESILAFRTSSLKKAHLSKLVTCFISLTTENFEDGLAHLANSDKQGITEFEKLGELNEEDVKNLKKEILDNSDVLPPIVIRYVQELNKN